MEKWGKKRNREAFGNGGASFIASTDAPFNLNQ